MTVSSQHFSNLQETRVVVHQLSSQVMGLQKHTQGNNCPLGMDANNMITEEIRGRGDGSSPPSLLLSSPLQKGVWALELSVVCNLVDPSVITLESITLQAMQSLLIRT